MNNLTTDLKTLQKETLLNLKNSKANNTVRAYKSDFQDFGLFCAQNGFKSLPSEPKVVSFYLTQLSTKDIKISTIKRRLRLHDHDRRQHRRGQPNAVRRSRAFRS